MAGRAARRATACATAGASGSAPRLLRLLHSLSVDALSAKGAPYWVSAIRELCALFVVWSLQDCDKASLQIALGGAA